MSVATTAGLGRAGIIKSKRAAGVEIDRIPFRSPSASKGRLGA